MDTDSDNSIIPSEDTNLSSTENNTGELSSTSLIKLEDGKVITFGELKEIVQPKFEADLRNLSECASAFRNKPGSGVRMMALITSILPSKPVKTKTVSFETQTFHVILGNVLSAGISPDQLVEHRYDTVRLAFKKKKDANTTSSTPNQSNGSITSFSANGKVSVNSNSNYEEEQDAQIPQDIPSYVELTQFHHISIKINTPASLVDKNPGDIVIIDCLNVTYSPSSGKYAHSAFFECQDVHKTGATFHDMLPLSEQLPTSWFTKSDILPQPDIPGALSKYQDQVFFMKFINTTPLDKIIDMSLKRAGDTVSFIGCDASLARTSYSKDGQAQPQPMLAFKAIGTQYALVTETSTDEKSQLSLKTESYGCDFIGWSDCISSTGIPKEIWKDNASNMLQNVDFYSWGYPDKKKTADVASVINSGAVEGVSFGFCWNSQLILFDVVSAIRKVSIPVTLSYVSEVLEASPNKNALPNNPPPFVWLNAPNAGDIRKILGIPDVEYRVLHNCNLNFSQTEVLNTLTVEEGTTYVKYLSTSGMKKAAPKDPKLMSLAMSPREESTKDGKPKASTFRPYFIAIIPQKISEKITKNKARQIKAFLHGEGEDIEEHDTIQNELMIKSESAITKVNSNNASRLPEKRALTHAIKNEESSRTDKDIFLEEETRKSSKGESKKEIDNGKSSSTTDKAKTTTIKVPNKKSQPTPMKNSSTAKKQKLDIVTE